MDFYNTFFMVMLSFGGLMALVTLVLVLRRGFSREAGEIGGWELRGAPRRIAAVARTTVAEGLRAKVASGFALLILVSLPVFYFAAEGDGTIKGQVQMFMIYSLGLTSFLLSLLTIFFSCRSLSVEVASRQIYSIVSKPIPRWQILAGKWVGIMSVNVVLLGIACVAAYVGTQATVSKFKTQLRHALATYGGLTPAQAADAVAALDHVRGAGKKGRESPVVFAMAEAMGITPPQVVDVLLRLPEGTRVNLRRFDELRRQVLVSRVSVSPKDRDLREDVDRFYRKLQEEGRLPEDWSEGKIREQIEKELLGGECTVPFGGVRTWRLKGPLPPKGRADFLMSVRFKINVSKDLPAVYAPELGQLERDTLLCLWGVGNPATPAYFEVLEPFAVRNFTEFEIPVDCLEEDGTIQVNYGNIDPRRADTVFDLLAEPCGLQVLYTLGTFETNLFQVFLAVLIEIACLAAFGVCCSTFLSFPVGSLIMIALFIISVCMPFVYEAVAVTNDYMPPELQDFQFQLRRSVVDVLGWGLSIGDCDPVHRLGNGEAVGWPRLWSMGWRYLLIKCGAAMAVAVLVFRRRELAAVIV